MDITMDTDGQVPSAATEHPEPTAALFLQHDRACERGDAATEHICIGSCWLHWSNATQLELGILSQLDQAIQDRTHIPVALTTLLDIDSEEPVVEHKSPSSCVEAIARCVAAFQLAAAATEHSECNEITLKLCKYAHTIARKSSPYRRHCIMECIHQYIENRTYDVALRNVLDGTFIDEDRFWSCVRDERQRQGCLTVIEIIRNALTDEADALRHELRDHCYRA